MIRAIDIVTPELFSRRLKRGVYRTDEFGNWEKRCSRCAEFWPADSEFFYTSRAEADGLHCMCKACYLDCRYPAGRSGTLQTHRASA